MKKIFSLVLFVVLCFALVACGNKYTQIGTSDLYFELPNGYEMIDDDFDDDQIAYYFKDDQSIDFDIYQWDKNGQYTLEDEANYFATEYNSVAQAIKVNGINGFKYESVESYDGETYTVVNYMFEDDKYIVEICFWTVDQAEKDFAQEIIDTLKKD